MSCFFTGFRERGKECERERNIILPDIYAFIGWLLYLAWPEIQPTTLAYWDYVLTNWTTRPGLCTCCFHCLQYLPSIVFSLQAQFKCLLFLYLVFLDCLYPSSHDTHSLTFMILCKDYSFAHRGLYYAFHMCISCYFKGRNYVLSHVSIPSMWGKLKGVLVTIGFLVCLNRTVWTIVEMLHLSHNVAVTDFCRTHLVKFLRNFEKF